MNKRLRLIANCEDQVGIVSKISSFLAAHDALIVEANHHTDVEDNQFYMRHEIEMPDKEYTGALFQKGLETLGIELKMEWKLFDTEKKKRVVIMATKESHCLVDILHKWHSGELDCEIVAIVANHSDLEHYGDWYSVPFHVVNFNNKATSLAFSEIENIIDSYSADVIALARFMRILPKSLCEKYSGKVINIHHSFLPSFIGAKPYHRAYARGVKLIGATCHYVTQDLDEGPIIEQEVLRVNHTDNVDDLILKGKECEKLAFSRGLRDHIQDRVIVHGNKTIVFS